MHFRYFEKEQFSHSADKLALLSADVVQFLKLAPGINMLYKS